MKTKKVISTMVLVEPSGKETFHHTSAKLKLGDVYALIGCDCVAMIKVRYRGKVRDAYLDDNGFMTQPHDNPFIKYYAEAYYKQPCQTFMGPAVIWVPNQEITE